MANELNSEAVKEYGLNAIRLGQQGVVTTDAAVGKAYEAEVSYISPRAISQAGSTSVEFEIHANLNNSDTDIKIGMNAFLDIVTDTKDDVFAVPLSAIVTNENGIFIYAYENSGTRDIPVTIGIRTSTHAEIESDDLYEGLVIVTNPGR